MFSHVLLCDGHVPVHGYVSNTIPPVAVTEVFIFTCVQAFGDNMRVHVHSGIL